MGEFLDKYAAQAQDAMDEHKNPPAQHGQCPECHCPLTHATNQFPHIDNDLSLYRCQDCPFTPTMCKSCIVKDHRTRPFDQIQKWCVQDQCWVKTSLPQLGYVIFLGHGQVCCPRYARRADGTAMYQTHARQMVVLHEHGVVNVNVIFCMCNPAPSHAQQLIMAGLWPVTWEQPRTATTLAALELFHCLSLQAQVNVHDFLSFINCMTDAVLTNNVQVSMR